MNVRFGEPLWLLALPLVLAWMAFAVRRARVRLGMFREATAFTLRALAVLCLVLLLSRFSWLQQDKGRSIVFALDVSASGGEANRERALRLMHESLRERKKSDRVGLLVLAREPAWDQTPEIRERMMGPRTKVNPTETDLEVAWRFVRAAVPEGSSARLVLFSDGRQTRGDLLGALAREPDPGAVPVDVVPFLAVAREDVSVQRVDAPPRVAPGEPFTLRVQVASTVPGPATVRVLKGSQVIAEQPVEFMEPGSHRLSLLETVDEPGFVRYSVTIESPVDRVAENNEGYGIVRVEGVRPVLVAGDRARELADLLLAAGLPAFAGGPEQIPSDPKELTSYSAVVLDNLGADRLGTGQMDAMKTWVNTLGGGLIALGGPESFGLGGNFMTPLEDTLPVTSDLRSKRQYPSLAMIMCIDKSGSMGGVEGGRVDKLTIAREAAIHTIEILGPQDSVGVIGFDSAAKWVVKLAPAEPPGELIKGVQSLQVGGGTDIYPALALATERLENTEAALKHVILLSDGISTSADFAGITGRMKASGITLTTVAIGSDADQATMDWLAKNTGGRTYFTNNLQLIPRIFTKEAVIASRSYLMEDGYSTSIKDWHPVITDLGARSADVGGYVATAERPLAKVIVQTSEGDPLLAWHQFGAGQAFAWTSDSHGRWNGPWQQDGAFGRMLLRMVRACAGLSGPADITLHLSAERGLLTVQALRASQDERSGPLVAEVLPPQGQARRIPLHPAALGIEEGQTPLTDRGVYLVSVHAEKPSAQDPPAALAFFALNAQEEFRNTGPDLPFLEEVARQTGGRILTDAGEAFRPQERRFLKQITRDPWWIVLACIFLLGDVAVRRIAWEPAWAGRLSARWKERQLRAAAERNAARRRVAVPDKPDADLDELVAPTAPPPSAGTTSLPPPAPGTGHLTDRLLEKKKKKDP